MQSQNQQNPQANKPIQLLAFRVRAETSGVLDLDVYETIGESFWGDSISAKDVLGQLREAKASQINVRINSGGGDLFDGIAIYNLLRASGAKISVIVDGVAASAASVIALAADPGALTIASGAFMMIHEARGGVYGTASELEGAAGLIRKANATMSTLYSQAAAKRGVAVDAETFAKLMAAETWLTGEEALVVGLADAVSEAPALAASIDLSAFRKTPHELTARIAPPVPEAPKEPDMSAELQAALDAHKVEVATLKSANEKLTIEAEALKSQNAALVAERDAVSAKLQEIEAKAIESEVESLIPNVLDAAERDNFVALAKTSRALYDSMVAQRKPRNLTSQIVTQDLPVAVTTASVDADDQFNALVEKDLT